MKTLNRNGFTLVSALISVVIGSLLLLALLDMITLGQSTIRTFSSQIDLEKAVQQAGMFLRQSKNCENYFVGKKFDGSLPALSSQIIPNAHSPEALVIDLPDAKGTAFLASGVKLAGNLTIDSVSLKQFHHSGNEDYTAKLVVSAKTQSGIVISRETPVGFRAKKLGKDLREITQCRMGDDDGKRSESALSGGLVYVGTCQTEVADSQGRPSPPDVDDVRTQCQCEGATFMMLTGSLAYDRISSGSPHYCSGISECLVEGQGTSEVRGVARSNACNNASRQTRCSFACFRTI